MSAFTGPADLRLLDHYRWLLLAPIEYHVGTYPSACVITVPAGTITDLASVPRALWAIFPPHGRWAKAAIVHDWLYARGAASRRWADGVLLEAMAVLGVPRPVRWLMFAAVRLFGASRYTPISTPEEETHAGK